WFLLIAFMIMITSAEDNLVTKSIHRRSASSCGVTNTRPPHSRRICHLTCISKVFEVIKVQHCHLVVVSETSNELTTAELEEGQSESEALEDENLFQILHVAGKKKSLPRRSWIWTYFECITRNIGKCKLCQRKINYSGKTGNINRHLNSIVAFFTEKKKHLRSWVWGFFDRVSRNICKCRLCWKNISHSLSNMNRHLSTDILFFLANCWIWRVFDRTEDNFCVCRISDCKYKLAYSDKCVSYILRHLRTDHDVVSDEQVISGTESEHEVEQKSEEINQEPANEIKEKGEE
ncbi:hypothetical protein ACJJTC_009951, partial [Scirpophaga incertulas]